MSKYEDTLFEPYKVKEPCIRKFVEKFNQLKVQSNEDSSKEELASKIAKEDEDLKDLDDDEDERFNQEQFEKMKQE